jgi:hypothetical protein
MQASGGAAAGRESAGRGEANQASRGSWGPRGASLLLLLLVVLFCGLTRWGRTYPTFARKTYVTWAAGHRLTAEQRRLQSYDETYPALLYVAENTPPDAVVLFAPGKLLGATPDQSPVMASASSAYNFIYPRVPVHWGDPAPLRDRVDYILVYNHWGLDLADPGATPTDENRVMLYPWPRGKKLP